MWQPKEENPIVYRDVHSEDCQTKFTYIGDRVEEYKELVSKLVALCTEHGFEISGSYDGDIYFADNLTKIHPELKPAENYD